MKPTAPLLILVLVVLSFHGTTLAESVPSWDTLRMGPHDAGFRLLEETDPSRAIRPTGSSGVAHPRPVRIHVWYPAKAGEEAKAMTYGRYAAMADEDVWPESVAPGARERLAYERRAFARSLGEEGYAEFLQRTVAAFENAKPAEGSFPLIIIGQGLYFESPISHAALSEYLASHGFVVATCPLVGTHSPLVHLDVEDLETHVRDMEFVIARMREFSFVDGDKLGLFGFDMGGMSAVVLAMRNPDVDAFASVDSGILFGHPAGIPVSSPHYEPTLLRVPWFHATQRPFATVPEGYDGPRLFEDAKHSERFLLLTDGMGHADFTSYALVEDRGPMMLYWGPRRGGEKERYEAVVRYLAAFLEAYLAGNSVGLNVLRQDPEVVNPGFDMTLEHRGALPVRPVYSDFLNALLTGNPDGALTIAADIQKNRPDSPIQEEAVLNRLGYHLLYSWRMPEESIAVFRVNTQIHPQSVNVWDSLAEAYWRNGDNENALKSVRKVLELDPENERAKGIVKELEAEAGS